MSRLAILCCALVAVAFVIGSPAVAAVIDFESTPSAAIPSDNLVLSTPYAITGGGTVQFYFDVNSNNAYDPGIDDNPVFEQAGQDGSDAFNSTVTGINDTAAPGFTAQLGNFFLRHPSPFSLPPPFLIDYNTAQTITGLSGEIWDIDSGAGGNTEQWLVDVLDGSNNLLASQLSPLDNSSALDSLPWTFAFTGLPLGVDKVRLTFVGTKTTGIGLAFNNFSPTTAEAVPEPSSVMLMGLAGTGLITAIRRRRAS
jgi:hypothetical protein